MKTSVKFYSKNQLQTVNVYKTKKEALVAKNKYIQSFTVSNRVKDNVQAILVSGNACSQVNCMNTDL